MTTTHITPKSFRYRNGSESNRMVMTTSQNQSILRGFDVSDMTPKQIENLGEKWNTIKNQNWSLTAKESHLLKNYRPSQGRFKTFKISRIRYFHDCLLYTSPSPRD